MLPPFQCLYFLHFSVEKRGESAARSELTACLSTELGWKMFLNLPFQYRGFDALSLHRVQNRFGFYVLRRLTTVITILITVPVTFLIIELAFKML